MFENFKKITIKGGYFESETELEVFKKYAISVVYGRNGSGKSTIARSIRCLIAEDGSTTKENSGLEVKSDVVIPEDLKSSVYVFDEDFVNSHVKVASEGLDTIVMLGEQVELDGKIEKAQRELERLIEKGNQLDEKKQKYNNPEDKISPLYYYGQIKDGFREKGGWFDVIRTLEGKGLRSLFTNTMLNKLLEMDEPKTTYDELRKQLLYDLILYQKAIGGREVHWKDESLGLPWTLKEVEDVLTYPLDNPELSDRELRLMDLINMVSFRPQHFSQENTKEMIEQNWDFCPLCLREINGTDRKNAAETLKRILNEKAMKYENKLNGLLEKLRDREVELPVFPEGLFSDEINAAQVALTHLNKTLADIRGFVEHRKRNIYTTMDDAISEKVRKIYSHALNDWKKARHKIKECVEKYNEAVYQHQELHVKILDENYQVARKRFSSILNDYRFASENQFRNSTALDNNLVAQEKKKKTIRNLQQQKERTDIALDYINQELQYVFYNKRKIRLEQGKGCYLLKVNGRSVEPDKISVGERNVLGLCYYFAMFYKGKKDAKNYSSEYLAVIDDPVSSFDYGNRVGVMSLLRDQFDKILKGNANSRILVMSHDLHSVFDLVKVRNDILGKSDKSFLELVNRKLDVKNVQNEYKKLLDQVYEYAADDREEEYDDVLEMSIGNIMRRMMEAFSSFCYNEPFEKMAREENVLALVPEKKRGYYENLMWRLVLNSESHTEEGANSLSIMAKYFTREEKQKTAKSLLLFLYYINKVHLVAYLKEKNEKVDKIKKIESWMTEDL